MSADLYQQIVALRNETNVIKRGRDFEQLIREIQPWDHRPPIVSSQDSEQLDGVYVYKGLTFIIESKAIKKAITPGMHEWEDFELKLLRRRDKRIVGLYCSLNEVSKKTIDRAVDLNLRGVQTLVIAGKTWDELNKNSLYFPSVLDYLLLQSNIKNNPSIDNIKNVINWIYDGQSISKNFTDYALKVSGSFLRRFKHRYHEQLFVERKINTQIKSIVSALAPQSLKSDKTKDVFKQIIVVRDFSGSGKTTLSINLASTHEYSFCFATTANLNLIDEVLETFFSYIKYPHHGINELFAVNKPLLFIVDSLDETPLSQHVHKRKEIKSLLKKIDELNSEARKYKLHIYPIAILFTVREEYWRNWEATLEGRPDVIQLKKVLSNFNNKEFPSALSKYSSTYNYSILNSLDNEAENILSVPINLEIFSEASHYDGEITITEIWEGKILNNFFSKKEEALEKHHLVQFNNIAFYKLLCTLAFKLLLDKTTLFSKSHFKNVLGDISTELLFNSDLILTNLISEQIITIDTDDIRNYRFKYVRFIEYLVALHIIQTVEETLDFTFIDNSIEVIYESNIISIYSVHKNIKHISRTQFTEIENQIIDYFSKSEKYLSNLLPELRGKISRGEDINEESIKSIITSNFTQTPSSSWNTFFILSAKKIIVKKETIIAAFEIAWDTNHKNEFRWKLIQKMASRGLLLEEKVIFILFKDGTSREWEEYLGNILMLSLNDVFLDFWEQIGGEELFRKKVDYNIEEWSYSNRLLELIYRGDGYVQGDIFSNNLPKNYIIFEKSTSKKLPHLHSSVKTACDQYIQDFISFFSGTEVKNSPYHRPREFSKEAHQYINISLDYVFTEKFGENKIPFFNYIIAHSSKYKDVLRMIFENPYLELLLNEIDIKNRSLFIEVIESDYHNKASLLELIFDRGYQSTDRDHFYIDNEIIENPKLNASQYESILIGYCFIMIKRKENYILLNSIYRELCVLLSAKFNRIVYFRFPNFLQVANNALEHYKEFGNLFLRAFQIYGQFPELESKPSFEKKILKLQGEAVPQTNQYNSLLQEVFPELF